MRRLLLIAGREYLAYVKTAGFWISLLSTPLLMGVFYGGPVLLQRAAPAAQVSVIDLTDSPGLMPLVTQRAAERGLHLLPPPDGAGATLTPAQAGKLFAPALNAPRREASALDVGVVVHRDGPQIALDVWSRTAAGSPDAEGAVRDAVSDWMRGDMLTRAGLDPGLARALQNARPQTTRYLASGEGLGFANSRLPGLVSFALAMALFVMIMAGAGILLNGVIEEKSSRILEVLLTSAEPYEIVFAKILGAAGVAATLVAVWAGVGLGVLTAVEPAMAREVGELFIGKGLGLYFVVYLVGGYVMFGAIFTAVGSFCETTREAQSLLGPLMILLILPVVVMTQALVRPDLPLLSTLSWVPNFTPFLMLARAGSGPPAWQVAGTMVEMAACTIGVVWVATRAFRTGALTSGKITLAGLIARVRQGE